MHLDSTLQTDLGNCDQRTANTVYSNISREILDSFKTVKLGIQLTLESKKNVIPLV